MNDRISDALQKTTDALQRVYDALYGLRVAVSQTIREINSASPNPAPTYGGAEADAPPADIQPPCDVEPAAPADAVELPTSPTIQADPNNYGG